MKPKKLNSPSKEWLNDLYKYDKSVNYPDKNEYEFPKYHLNYVNAEKYLKNIIKYLKYNDIIYKKIFFTKSQPCIYNNYEYSDHSYWWSYSGKINIYVDDIYKLNKKTYRKIKYEIDNLNIGYEYICEIYFKDKKIYSKLK